MIHIPNVLWISVVLAQASDEIDGDTIVYYWHGEDQIRHLVGARWTLDT